MHPSQWESDGLTAFEVVDPILVSYIEDDEDPETIAARGFDPALVRRVIALVEAAEYKRRQAPVGIKISVRAFGRDRRMPITHRFASGWQRAPTPDAAATAIGTPDAADTAIGTPDAATAYPPRSGDHLTVAP